MNLNYPYFLFTDGNLSYLAVKYAATAVLIITILTLPLLITATTPDGIFRNLAPAEIRTANEAVKGDGIVFPADANVLNV